ncbi:sugar isomerase domain-containing protein [bacterium]|nr:sugar isomerase domain-containing protein [bacterium]
MKSMNESIALYSNAALPQLKQAFNTNLAAMERIESRLVKTVKAGGSLLIFGSGHSSLFPLEFYHRAGGPSFVIPLVADFLMPTAGPPVARILERTPGLATVVLRRAEPKKGEMLWLSSQSGVNAGVIDVAIEAKKLGLHTVAFTSLRHSKSVPSRHPSKKKLFEVCDETMDLGGMVGDAAVPVGRGVSAGPLSTLTGIFLGHSILVSACATLEKKGVRCVYTSVNTPEGEKRNRKIEQVAALRDPLLR